MRHFAITIFSGLIFLTVIFFAGILPVSPTSVSRETWVFGRYRETVSVKQGVSQDGLLAITKIPGAPMIPLQAKSANHTRTLRAFFASNRGGVFTLYVESVKPHEYYALTGGFAVTGDYPVVTWRSATVLEFYGKSLDGELMRYTADLHLLTLSGESIEQTISISAKNVPASNLLP